MTNHNYKANISNNGNKACKKSHFICNFHSKTSIYHRKIFIKFVFEIAIL